MLPVAFNVNSCVCVYDALCFCFICVDMPLCLFTCGLFLRCDVAVCLLYCDVFIHVLVMLLVVFLLLDELSIVCDLVRVHVLC